MGVVYTHELDAEEWDALERYIDVVTLWVWNAKPTWGGVDDEIARCRERFAGKPVVMGAYLRDYPSAGPVPMQMVKLQWEAIGRRVADGTLAGYSILSANLIDGHQEQARWIREFIGAGGPSAPSGLLRLRLLNDVEVSPEQARLLDSRGPARYGRVAAQSFCWRLNVRACAPRRTTL